MTIAAWAIAALALALALVPGVASAGAGWYLLVPGFHDVEKGEVAVDRPLRNWAQERAFDTAASCEARRLDRQQGAETVLSDPKVAAELRGERGKLTPVLLWQVQGLFGRCVASDDPRLK